MKSKAAGCGSISAVFSIIVLLCVSSIIIITIIIIIIIIIKYLPPVVGPLKKILFIVTKKYCYILTNANF